MQRRAFVSGGILLGAAAAARGAERPLARASEPLSSAARSTNHALIGKQHSRQQLATPALILDLDVLESNLAAMARHCRHSGLRLRPHSKTHKSVKIARLQIQAGAVGVCCSTLGEAETLAAGGIDGILITNPVVTPEKIVRLEQLNRRLTDLTLVVDNPGNVAALQASFARSSKPLQVLVDVDVQDHRSGCADVESAVALVQKVSASSSLRFAGLQGYAGRAQHVANSADRRKLVTESCAILAAIADRLKALELPPKIVSGGGTGTYDMLPSSPPFNELQAGSYIFMDAQYNDVWTNDNRAPPFGSALLVQSVVISNNHPGYVTTDAGQKRYAMDAGVPIIASGAPRGARYTTAGDEHGIVIFPDESASLQLGSRVECITPHCDPTVNLFDVYHCVRADVLVDIWPVDARGA